MMTSKGVGWPIYQKRKLAYCGLDMHKDTHTAVIIDCWMRTLGEITFANRPGRFDQFLREVKTLCGELTPVFGLEDTRSFGRSLALYLSGHKCTVKHVNPAYTSSQRASAPTVFKNDSHDAFCVACVLRDQIDKLPDVDDQDIFWTLRQLVKRRDSLVKGTTVLQNQLHGQLMYNYPSYRKFFADVDGKTALSFWENYPSPEHVKGLSVEALAVELRAYSRNSCSTRKAQEILSLVASDACPTREFQEKRDFIVTSIVKEIRYQRQEMADLDNELADLMALTGYKLETMPGIRLNMASHLVSEIGDIERFPNSDKLARFAGIAPVAFSSAGKGKDQRSRQGNRALNGIFYFLAIELVQVSPKGTPRHPVFHAYFHRKLKEGKSKPQALVCIQRRIVRIIYGMMKNKTEYRPFKRLED